MPDSTQNELTLNITAEEFTESFIEEMKSLPNLNGLGYELILTPPVWEENEMHMVWTPFQLKNGADTVLFDFTILPDTKALSKIDFRILYDGGLEGAMDRSLLMKSVQQSIIQTVDNTMAVDRSNAIVDELNAAKEKTSIIQNNICYEMEWIKRTAETPSYDLLTIYPTEEPDTNSVHIDSNNDSAVDNPIQNEATQEHDYTLDTLWAKLKGVWYNPNDEDANFFVIDYDEANSPIACYVWGFEKSESCFATGISMIETDKYNISFRNSTGKWEWIFQMRGNGEISVTDVEYDSVNYYQYLSPTLAEAYDSYNMYGDSISNNISESTVGANELSIYEAQEKIKETLLVSPLIIEYIGDYTWIENSDCYNFLVSVQVSDDYTERVGHFAVHKKDGYVLSSD